MPTEKKPGLLLVTVITIAYLGMVFLIGVAVVYLYSMIWPTDFTTAAGTAIAAAIFAGVAVLDLGLLAMKKLTPAILAIVVAISPYLVVYRLLRNVDLLVVDTNTPDRVAKYVFVKGAFAGARP